MANYPAALAAMEAAVHQHCPELPAFTVRLQFEDEDGGNTFTREFPVGPAPVHDARTGVISSAIGEVVARVVHARGKWRTGTPREATRESLRAALGVKTCDGGQQ